MDLAIGFALGMAVFGAAIVMAIGSIGPALGEGRIATQAVKSIAEHPEQQKDLLKIMLVGQAVTESTGIYSLVVAMLILFLALPTLIALATELAKAAG
ncbi:ATP synthase F0 subunit C [bacterium]|nr:ATP synthase F0 subunit C [candidate division CSSED10-310 bacterium]